MRGALLVGTAYADTVARVNWRPSVQELWRPRRRRGQRRALIPAAAGVAIIVASALTGGSAPVTPPEDATVTQLGELDAPQDFMADRWIEILEGGGAQPVDSQADVDLDRLSDPALSDLGAEAATAAATAEEVLTAYLRGVGQERWPGHFDDPFAAENSDADVAGTCETVTVTARAAAALPGPRGERTDVAKVLLLWSGNCPALALAAHAGGTEDLPERMSFVYLRRSAGGWTPVRVTELPGSAAGYVLSSGGSLYDWQLDDFGDCGGGAALQALGEVTAAWSAMCAAAAADEVTLRLLSAYRDPVEQGALFEDAVEFYGDEDEARRWVASSDGVDCASRHCAGTAVDVELDPDAIAWLTAPVGCYDSAQRTLIELDRCAADAAVVQQAQLYGFARTLAHQGGHLEYVLVTESASAGSGVADCSPPRSLKVQEIVARVWRCQLGAAGLSAEQVRVVVAEAVMVSRCASAWNADAVELGGRFVDEPHPVTGRIHDGLGVFQLTAREATQFNTEWPALTDPVLNSAVAAKLWLAQSAAGTDVAEGWRSWGCATGDGTQPGALPSYGGDAVPPWAYEL